MRFSLLIFLFFSFFRCLKCNEYLCLSSEIRKIGSQYACISDDLKNHVFCKKSDKIVHDGKEITIGHGKFICRKCGEGLGNFGLHKEIYFPLPYIKAIKIEDDLKKGDTLKKWKEVEKKYFTPSPLTEEDLERIAGAGKLVDFDWALMDRYGGIIHMVWYNIDWFY